MSNALIVDYAWSHPDLDSLIRVGYSGVARYLSPDPTKNLSPNERDAVLSRGMSIILVWEATANRVLSGRQGGAVDGQSASAQADALALPNTCPIYFAVDFDATDGQLPTIEQYLSGAQSNLHGRPIGVYGSASVVDHMLLGGRAVFGWQTAAWSGGRVLPHAHLYQRVSPTRPHVPGSYDEDVVLNDNYGQWTLSPVEPIKPADPGPHDPPITYIDEEENEMRHREVFDCGNLDGQGNAQILWGGGTTGEPGVADFAPAIPYDKFRNVWVHGGFGPVDGHPAAPGRPTAAPQQRDGKLTVEFTGGVPGLKLDVELEWAD